VNADSTKPLNQVQLAEFVIFSDLITVEQMTSIMGYSADFSLAKGAVREGAKKSHTCTAVNLGDPRGVRQCH
jgi:hypothetical protein